jgi:hypothetical protein
MQMGEIAESHGLEWGGRWKRSRDLPHLQNSYRLGQCNVELVN